MSKVPVIPMFKILAQWKAANDLPFRLNRLEELIRCYHHYCKHAKCLN
jgi:hypothetical protein